MNQTKQLNMKKIALFLLVLTFGIHAKALNVDGDTSWKSKYEASLGFSQTSFTNWAAGGENASAVNGCLTFIRFMRKGLLMDHEHSSGNR